MERDGKVTERDGGEEEEEGEEFIGLKLKRSILVGKRGGPCTPPPTWNSIGSHPQTLNTATARQLGANLWEILPHLHPISKNSNMSNNNSSSFLLRRHGNHHNNQGLHIQPVLEEKDDAGECSSSHLPDQPRSTGSVNRQIAESLRRNHRSVNKSGRAVQPVSPASFGSSMELTQYNPGGTPSSSVGLNGRAGASSSLKTSTELLKVLNRIWSLEEQHASNVSLVRALKNELDNSRVTIKELVKEKQMERKVTDDLMRQLAEGKFGRKNMEQERLKLAMQSLREELEEERKLRKRSESVQHKLGRELSDVKSCFSKNAREVERERRARVLLEELCDELALGIRYYEQEMRSGNEQEMRSGNEQEMRSGNEQACGRGGQVDSLVVQMSEGWLEERVQMRLSEGGLEKQMVAEKLRSEIEAFLRAKEKGVVHHKSNIRRRSSLESYRLNEATSAPKNADEDDESFDSESNCFELSKAVDDLGIAAGTTQSQQVSRLQQSRFHEHMMKKSQSASKRYSCMTQGGLARNNSSSVEGDRVHPEDALVGPTSPVKKWDPQESFSLKARLLQARSEGTQRHLHSKATKS